MAIARKPITRQKASGAYYTPDAVASTLVSWALRDSNDRLLDPSCGDGRFIAGHRNSVGIEQDPIAARAAMERAPWALVHEGEFFSWAGNTVERFDCAAGNPPFIRYQTFSGDVRGAATRLCAAAGAQFSGLSSSWAPFLVATATLLKPGGRMAFVVPAEIGHAPYSAPLLEYLVKHFSVVHVVAIQKKLFPDLSEDCWLLFADGFGHSTDEIRFTSTISFNPTKAPPRAFSRVSVADWRLTWNRRLRPFLLQRSLRDLYQEVAAYGETRRLGDVAAVGIGYVSGANDFFHLRPSEAKRLGIPKAMLHPTVRNGRSLPDRRLTASTVERWYREDQQMLLLKLPKTGRVPSSVAKYLDSEAGHVARTAYKCRVRDPWYSVPDVQTPDFFLSYMSGLEPSLVRNDADCTCTNSVHSVRLRGRADVQSMVQAWETDFARLSCELEGHPLGGGMLKLEPREAAQIALPAAEVNGRLSEEVIKDGLRTLREWRHYVEA
ncbi:MAG: hypothetical protein LW835_10835 [Burkholderiaceae bacterium]|jgi:adenine-specific DNA methylase|nr:hypothetical protein [Burkholderiaceae bacterium]